MARVRTKDDLLKASEHVCYEIGMLVKMCIALDAKLGEESPIHNAFINSFAIHVRNLVDFLYEAKGKVKADFILAEHYFPPALDWTEIRPPMTDTLKEAKIRCDKQVAHLTYTRENKEPWHYRSIVRDLKAVLTVFVENIDTALLGTEFEKIEGLFLANASGK